MMPKFRVWDKEVQKFADWPVYFNLTNSEIVTELWYGYEIHIEEPLQDSNYIVQQSTGLKDKNGKEIYEGDIVKHDPVLNPYISDKYFEIIQARSGEWCMDNYRGGRVSAYGSNMVEVVGNKFEHRDLLEEE